MKVLFIQDNGINESLALCELSAALRAAGHETAVLLEREERDLFAAIDRFAPDWFLIPCSILAHTWALGMARRVKERFPERPVILGGTHPTASSKPRCARCSIPSTASRSPTAPCTSSTRSSATSAGKNS